MAAVTWTVVSVIPYMLTRRQRSSGCRSNQPSSGRASSGSPPSTTSRRAGSPPPVRSAAASWVNAEGVWLSTFTRSRASSAWKSSGWREVQWSTTTSRPPVSSAPQISHTEKSNAAEWKHVQASSGERAKSSRTASTRAVTLACGTRTPLGRPVEPEVWMTYAGPVAGPRDAAGRRG